MALPQATAVRQPGLARNLPGKAVQGKTGIRAAEPSSLLPLSSLASPTPAYMTGPFGFMKGMGRSPLCLAADFRPVQGGREILFLISRLHFPR